MPPLPPYDQAFLRRQAAITRRILKHYEDGINYLVPTLNVIKHNGRLFRLSDYPVLKKKVEQMAGKLQNQVYSTLVNGVKDSWDWANKKNDVLVDKRLAGSRLKKKVRQALYDPNDAALRRFIERKEKGLDLSARVWKTVDPFKKELEQGLGIGIGKGESAQEMARELKKNLRDPDRLFRRVRGEDGKLHLSAAARAFHPGQGVYRSSFKNALRLTRTETNMAYRSSDHERWKGLPFVTGIQVKLSSAHPKYDICDHLAGKYPKDFKFVGWHPQCLCFAVPELMDDEEYDKIEDQLLAGQPITVPSSSLIQAPPPAFGKYLVDNKEMLAKLKSEPYWMRDNKQYLSSKPVDNKGKLKKILGENVIVDTENLDEFLLNAIYNVQKREMEFKFSGVIKNDSVSLLGASSDNELNIGKRFNKNEIEKSAFLSKHMDNRKNFSSASRLINEKNGGASEYAEYIVEHELNHVKQNYLNAAAKGGWGDKIEKRAKKWQKEWIKVVESETWIPSNYANAIRDIAVREKEWLAESYLLYKHSPNLIESKMVIKMMQDFENLLKEMAYAK